MQIIHDIHATYSLDCLMKRAYIFYQAVGSANCTLRN
jgi:hypothetical protein